MQIKGNTPQVYHETERGPSVRIRGASARLAEGLRVPAT